MKLDIEVFRVLDMIVQEGSFAKAADKLHKAQSAVSYQINKQISAYLDAQYTGQRYKAGDEGNIAGQLGGYTVYNANLRWDHDDLYVNVRINNLSGKKYNGYHGYYNYSDFISGDLVEVEYGYPSPEQTVEVTLGYNF